MCGNFILKNIRLYSLIQVKEKELKLAHISVWSTCRYAIFMQQIHTIIFYFLLFLFAVIQTVYIAAKLF